jgi:hypothetical protein
VQSIPCGWVLLFCAANLVDLPKALVSLAMSGLKHFENEKKDYKFVKLA